MIWTPEVGDEQGFLEFIRARVAALIPPGRVLDVGAGGRPIAGAVAVDLSPRPGQIGADLSRLPFRSRLFDAVACVNVLGCISREAQRSGLRELVRVLRPGGSLVLTSPNLEHPLVAARARRHPWPGGVREPWLRSILESMGASRQAVEWILPKSLTGNPLAAGYGFLARFFPRLCPHFVSRYNLVVS